MDTKKIVSKIERLGRRLKLVEAIVEIARQDARKGDKIAVIEHTKLALNEISQVRCEIESLSYTADNDKSDWLNAVCFAFYGQVHEIERFIEAIQK